MAGPYDVHSPAPRVPLRPLPARRRIRIVWHPGGTHATAWAWEPASPSEGVVLSPGERYCGVGFDEWARTLGETVDVVELQAASRAARRRELRPRRVYLAEGEEEWVHDKPLGDEEPPAGAAYGFTTGRAPVISTRRRMVNQCVRVPETPGVWTPGRRRLVRPEEIPLLGRCLQRSQLERWRNHLAFSLAVTFVALAMGLTSGFPPAFISWPFVIAGLGAAWAISAAFEYLHVKRAGARLFLEARQEHRYGVWLGTFGMAHSQLLMAVLFLVMLAQLPDVETSIQAAGLVKSLVFEGERWRLLTGPLLHGGIVHLGVNLIAVWSLGPLVEAHGGRGAVPLVFVTSALAGSVASLYLVPEGISVGASGGILGLAGYLFALATRRSGLMPTRYHKRIGIGILATGVFGLFGYRFVDNAAHLGGLLAGAVLALILPPSLASHPLARERRLLGWTAWVILLAAAIRALMAMGVWERLG